MKTSYFLISMFFFLITSPVFPATDNFDEDPVLSADWELYEPLPGMTYSVEDGWWRVTIPSGTAFDHWVSADNALQLRRSDIPDDFFIETLIRFVGSGDPLNPTWPPVNESYMANLMVYFSQFDVFYWGPQIGTNIVLQRSGQAPQCSIDPGLQEVYIGIRKSGTEYTFLWKENKDDPWLPACTQDAVETPTKVGLMFKSWNPVLTTQETFEFDYFTISELQATAPVVIPPCEPVPGEDDIAWTGLPYVRHITTSGFPVPDISITNGPDGMFYEPLTGNLTEWIPEDEGTIAVEIEASNSAGTDSASWNVKVQTPSDSHEDDFDNDPRDNTDFWSFSEPQTGVSYSIVDENGSNWWRLDVPQFGDLGQNFDVWTTMDRSVQLRHTIEDPSADFLIETKIRMDPTSPPPFDAEFGAGLLVNFGGSDVLQWQVGQERVVNFVTGNVLLERSGFNNLALDYFPDLMQGDPILLRIEKNCGLYNAFWRIEGEDQWHYSGSYQTETPPQFVGLLMKTWGNGAAFTTDFDYFDIVEPGSGINTVSVFTGDANSDGSVNLADAITILSFLFAGGDAIPCLKSADVNDDGAVNLADAITILTYQFSGGSLTAPDGGALNSNDVGCHKYPPDEVTGTGCENPCTP